MSLARILPFSLPLVFCEIELAQPNVVRRHLDEFVAGDVIDRLLKGEFARRSEDDVLIAARSADVGELLGFGRIHDEIVVARVFPDNHPFIHFIARLDKERAALLEIEEAVTVGFAEIAGDHHAAQTADDIPFPRSECLKDGSEDSKTRGAGEEIVAIAHESAGRDEERHGRKSVLRGGERAHLPFAP